MGELFESLVCKGATIFNRKPNSSFTESTLQTCLGVRNLLGKETRVVLDGQSLDLSSVVAVARYVTFHALSVYRLHANLSLKTWLQCFSY